MSAVPQRPRPRSKRFVDVRTVPVSGSVARHAATHTRPGHDGAVAPRSCARFAASNVRVSPGAIVKSTEALTTTVAPPEIAGSVGMGGSEATNDGVGVDDGRALVVAVAGGGVVADGDGLTAEGAGVSGLTADGSAVVAGVPVRVAAVVDDDVVTAAVVGAVLGEDEPKRSVSPAHAAKVIDKNATAIRRRVRL